MDISGNARIVRRRLRHAATARGYLHTDAEVAAELAIWLGKLDHEVFGPSVRVPVVFSQKGAFSSRMLACYRSTVGQEAFMVFPAGLARRSRRMRSAITVPVSPQSDAGRLPRRWELLAAVAAHEVRHRFQGRASYVRLFTPAGAPKEPRDLVGFAWHELAVRYPQWARHMTTLNLSAGELSAQLHETEFDALVVEHVVLVLAALGQDFATLVQAITMDAPEAN
jgi:hypothetical protein